MNSEKVAKSVVILGSGLAGLSSAWVLSRKGYQVHILEKTAINGGLAVTKRRDGYEYDLGPHNIHTVHNHIVTFLRRHFEKTFFQHDPRSKILKNNKFIDYPLKGIRVITSLPVWRLPVVCGSFFMARVRMFLGNPAVDDSFEAWIRNRFGKALYDEYFGNYAGKVWGIAPKLIDKYVAEKRVPVINLTELIRATLLGKTARVNHSEFVDENFYLRHGIGELVVFFEQALRERGARIEHEVELAAVHSGGSKVTAVSYKTKSGESRQLECDYLLSTIPINSAVDLFAEAPGEVRQAAQALDYCSAVLLFLKVNRRNVLPSAMLYFSDPNIPFSRIYDVGMYSSAMVPDGKTMICLEFPCNLGDAIWLDSEANIGKIAIEILAREGVLSQEDVDGFFIEKISHSYPRFRLGFQKRVQQCFGFFARFENFISFGRQGSFAYLNTDGVINLGFNAADAVILSESMGYRCHEWFTAKTKIGH